MGEDLPYNPKEFVPKNSVITKLVDYVVDEK